MHSFAEAGRVGLGLAVIGGVTTVVTGAVAWRKRSEDRIGSARPLEPWTAVAAMLASAAAIVVSIGLVAQAFVAAVSDPVRIHGVFWARLLLPIAGAAVLALALLRRSRAGGKVPRRAWIAHAGFALAALGVLVSTADRSGSGRVDGGATVELAGVAVTNLGVEVLPGPRPGTSVVRADLELDGDPARPSLVAYPERGGTLAETVVLRGWWRDRRVVLVRADDRDRVLVEVTTRPGMPAVWAGTLVLAAGAGASALTRRRRPRPDPAPAPASSPTDRRPSLRAGEPG
ncbi:MAG: cytochrome c-type biogenesis CcmF C-terminal domain-containing protein [Ilumatobacteraceae bacterium]